MNNVSKEQIHNMRWIISFMKWYKMCHFREFMNYNKYWIIAFPRSKQSKNKIHGQVNQRFIRYKKRSIKTIRINLRFFSITSLTSFHHMLHILLYVWPMKMLLENSKDLCNIKIVMTQPFLRLEISPIFTNLGYLP